MAIDVVLIILGFLLLGTGLLGAVAPVLPGPPLSFGGILLIHFSQIADFSPLVLWIFGVLSLFSLVLDYLLPILGTKVAKGNKHTIQGATLGLIVGLFILPPFGMILGPFLGAFLAARVNGMHGKVALVAALGSFAGLFTAVIFKLVLSLAMIVTAIIAFF